MGVTERFPHLDNTRRGPVSAGNDLERLTAELRRKGLGGRGLESLRAGWEGVCHDPMKMGRGGSSLPENMPEVPTQIESEPDTDGPGQPEAGWSEVRYRLDPPNESPPPNINCAERLHLCKAACCKLNFALTPAEVKAGKVAWEPEFPYLIAHQPNGYCAHIDGELRCKIYEDRPALCRRYDCTHDSRIWKDFEKMIPNVEWIRENTSNENRIVLRALLPMMETGRF